MIEKIKFWYNNSRPYTIPITLLSWFVIYIYSLKAGGNAVYGIIAYIGIALVHLATNLADDYFDYKRLNNSPEKTKDCKLKYLKEGQAGIKDLRNVIILMLSIAAFTGLFLLFASGIYVIWLALCGLVIALSYSFISSRGLGDIAVILAYGPLMFEGVYYVMTGKFSFDVLILSFACAMFVNSILYAHMLMDYDEDEASNKTTLCTKLGSKERALNILMTFYIAGYLFIIYLSFKTGNILYSASLITLLPVTHLYKSLQLYNRDKTSLPKSDFRDCLFGTRNKILSKPSAPFLLRFIEARNISTCFMLICCISIILGKNI